MASWPSAALRRPFAGAEADQSLVFQAVERGVDALAVTSRSSRAITSLWIVRP
jgi:hypothetical protein